MWGYPHYRVTSSGAVAVIVPPGGWADNQILRGDGAFGIQGGPALEDDDGTIFLPAVATSSYVLGQNQVPNAVAPNNEVAHFGWNSLRSRSRTNGRRFSTTTIGRPPTTATKQEIHHD